MTTDTTTKLSYLDRVYQRLEERDNPYERNMADALSEALEFVENFVAKCNGTSDVPATRKEPGYCECVVDGSEEEEAARIQQVVGKAMGTFLICSPLTTFDLSVACIFARKDLRAFKAGEPRAEMQSDIEAILKVLS